MNIEGQPQGTNKNKSESELDAELMAKFAKFDVKDEEAPERTQEEIEREQKERDAIRATMLEAKYGKVTVKGANPSTRTGNERVIELTEERIAQLKKMLGESEDTDGAVIIKPPTPGETIH